MDDAIDEWDRFHSSLQRFPLVWNERVSGPASTGVDAGRYLMTLQEGDSFTLSVHAEGRSARLRAPSGGLLWEKPASTSSAILVPPEPGLLIAPTTGIYQLEFDLNSAPPFSFQANRIGDQALMAGQQYAGRLEPADVVATFAWNPQLNEAVVLDRVGNSSPFVDAMEAASRALTLRPKEASKMDIKRYALRSRTFHSGKTFRSISYC